MTVNRRRHPRLTINPGPSNATMRARSTTHTVVTRAPTREGADSARILRRMPYSLNVGSEDATRFDAFAEILTKPRDMVVDVPARHPDWEPAPGSTAAEALAADLFDPRLNRALVHLPRSVCSLYLRVAADYLAGISALLRTREIMFAPGALARAAFENAVRGVLVVDPRAETPKHVARALLDELASAHFERLTNKHLFGKADPAFTSADRMFAALCDLANGAFADLSLADDPHKWHIEGEHFLRMNAAAASWSDLRAKWLGLSLTAVEAEGYYDHLCLYTHPQGFASRKEADWGPHVEVAGFRTNSAQVIAVVYGALAATMDCAMFLYGYHGWDAPEIDQIAVATAEVWQMIDRE